MGKSLIDVVLCNVSEALCFPAKSNGEVHRSHGTEFSTWSCGDIKQYLCMSVSKLCSG